MRRVLPAVVAGSLMCVSAAMAADGQYGKFYWKNWEPLDLDASRVAVQASNAAAVEAGLKAVGVDVGAAHEFTVPGWWMVTTPPGVSPEQLVGQLAADANIDFATPVFFSVPMGANNQRYPIFPTRDVMVGFTEGLPAAQRDAAFTQTKVFDNGKATLRDRDWGNMDGVDRATAATKNGFEVLTEANTLAQRQDTRFAEPDMMITGVEGFIPNDTFFSDQWALNNTGQSGGVADNDLNAPQAWDVTLGSSSIVVVVLDIGVQLNHPDLNMAPSIDETGQNSGGYPVNSCDNHGTACAGCIAGIINNGIGVSGVAPGCRVASARIGISNQPCDGTWNGALSNTVNALNWAAGLGYRVTSNSNAYGSTSSTVDTAYTNTHNNNAMVHFAANGNSGAASIAYPASSPSVNGCAAIDRTGTKASFSQYGTGTKFASPGVAIDSTDRTGADGYTSTDYNTVDGTSFATPYTAGVAALVISRNPGLSATQVENAMYTTCKDRGAAGYDTTYGYGIPDARAAVIAAGGPAPGNDVCGNAFGVVSGGVYFGTLANATFSASDGGNNCGAPNTGPDVWYTFTSPGNGTLRVTTCGSNDYNGTDAGTDTVLSLHNGCGGAILACNDDWTSATTTGCTGVDAGLPRDSAVATTVTSGQVVKIRVQSYGALNYGSFFLNVFFTPANDNCGSAVDVSSAQGFGSGGQTFNGTLIGATNDATATCGSSATNPDVWYAFTGPSVCSTGMLRVTTCGTHDAPGQDLGMDTVLSLWTGCGGSEITCNDDWSTATTTGCAGLDGGAFRDSAVATTVAPGQTILIRVSKFGGVTPGPFQLHVFYTPLNDNCASATTVVDGTTNWCSYGATTDGPAESFCDNASDNQVGNDIWFRYTATCNGNATVSLCGSGFDTKLGVYHGTCPSASGSIIVCNDDFCGPQGVQSQVTFAANAGAQYLIRIGGYFGAYGVGTMNISCQSRCGSADFNCDGDIGTDADIEAFFRCLAGTCPPPPCTGNADFNGDGDIGTDADIEAFFRVLAGGTC